MRTPHPCRVRLVCCAISILVVSAPAARGQVRGAHLTVSPHYGVSFWGEDLGLEDRSIFGVRLGFMPVPSIGVEGTWGASDTETTGSPSFDTHLENIGVDVHMNLRPGHRWNPYIAGGWCELSFDSEGANDVVGPQEIFMNGWEAGAGVKVRLGQGDGFRADARLDVRDLMTDPSKLFEGSDSDDHSVLLSAGVHLSFSARGRKDADQDGVADEKDRCPDTPIGVLVDASGCPMDSDGDGVPDGLDACADTPRGATTDLRGCPSDDDGDGVWNGLDRCDRTPPDVTVDASGCPLDLDRDGVTDSSDDCPGTPAGVIVDARGCPRDSDGDGVFDGVDLCANTPAGRSVDEKGCPIDQTATEKELSETGMIRTSEIHFRTGSAEIDPGSKKILDEIGRTLAQVPDATIEISGHTDSQGSEAANQSLSARRAQAVLAHLREHFPEIRSERVSVRGYGESQPIATNDTAEGRAKNRRVEFKMLEKKE